MVSRETWLHVACVVAGLSALGALTAAGVTETFAGQVLALGLFYGLTFGGAHLYYAVRGEDGTVPVTSRWRFLALIGAGVVLLAITVGAGETELGGIGVQRIAGWAFLVVLVTYFVVEGVAGYRQSMRGA